MSRLTAKFGGMGLGMGLGGGGRITRFVINLLIATCTRATTRTVFGFPADGVIADGESLLKIGTNEPAISGGRFLAPGWSGVDDNGASLTTALSVTSAGTNKCASVKANPTDTTNIAKSGDVASTLTVVDDSAELAIAGLDEVCNGNVYMLNNSAGSIRSNATITGNVTNLNKHALSGYMRVSSGSGRLTLEATAAETFNNVNYAQIKLEDQTPAVTGSRFVVDAEPSSVVFFILPQLEETPFATPVIIGADTAASATRDADINTSTTPSFFDGTWAFEVEFNPSATGQTGTVYASHTDANNFVEVSVTSTTVILRKRVGGVNHDATFTYTHVAGTLARVQCFGGSTGTGIRVADSASDITAVAFITNANTTDTVWDTVINWGHLNGTLSFTGDYKNDGTPIAFDSKEAAGYV